MVEAPSNFRELVAGYETSRTINREKCRCSKHNEEPLERVKAERRPIWAVGADVWEERDKKVKAPKESHETQNDAADFGVDREEEVDEACEEEEYGYVEQRRDGIDGSRETKCFHALEKVLPCTGTLV